MMMHYTDLGIGHLVQRHSEPRGSYELSDEVEVEPADGEEEEKTDEESDGDVDSRDDDKSIEGSDAGDVNPPADDGDSAVDSEEMAGNDFDTSEF
jgi:hypothetical protein